MHPNHDAFRGYLARLVASATFFIALVAVFNLWVDPYRIFSLLPEPRAAAIKARPGSNIAQVKLFGAVGMQPGVLILGNSRAEIGFDPSHRLLRASGRNVYNLAVPGAGIQRVRDLFKAVVDRTDVDLTILAVDFQDFVLNARRPGVSANDDFSRYDSLLFRERAKALFTAAGTSDSIRTIRAGFDRYPESIRDDGFNPLLDYIPIARRDGVRAMFEQRLNETARNFALAETGLTPPGATISEEFLAFREILEIAREHGVRLCVVTYPYHADYYLLYRELGLWQDFKRWKLTLSDLVDDVRRARVTGSSIEFWDFAALSEPSIESIEDSDRVGAARWYWEAGHFKSPLGDALLTRMLDPNASGSDSSFGILVARGSFEAWLDAQDRRLQILSTTRPDLLQEVRSAVVRGRRDATASE